jgi:hypothetical protein
VWEDDIVSYLRRSGWVQQSVEAVLPDLPRWERRLRDRGVTRIPALGRPCSAADATAHNELNLLMLQASHGRNSSLEHDLRNLTEVRRHKV